MQLYINYDQATGLMSRVFVNGLGDWGSTPHLVIPKTQKNGTHVSLLNTRSYKAQIKGKADQSRERSSTLPSV